MSVQVLVKESVQVSVQVSVQGLVRGSVHVTVCTGVSKSVDIRSAHHCREWARSLTCISKSSVPWNIIEPSPTAERGEFHMNSD